MTVLVIGSTRAQVLLACSRLGLPDPFRPSRRHGDPNVVARTTAAGTRGLSSLAGLIPDRIIEVLPEVGESAALSVRRQASAYLVALCAKRDGLEVEQVFV